MQRIENFLIFYYNFRLLSEFFRDLDVVPSDVIAGLVLLRKFQKLERDSIVRQVNLYKTNLIVKTN